jgi:hypothetical protein
MPSSTTVYTDHKFDVATPGVEIEDTEIKRHDWREGVHTVYGIRAEPGPDGGETEVAGFHFDAGEFTPEEARAWLDDQGYGGAELVEKGGTLQRENPSGMDKTTTALLAGGAGVLIGSLFSNG